MATNQQNINLGSADNANDGDVLRVAFRKVKKMFAEIYGDTDAENLTDSESVPSTNFDTHITEKIQDVVGSMVTGNTENNITVTYDDSDGTLDFDVSASGDSATLYVDSFDGDGSDTTFDLSQSISDENNTQVYIDGVYQSKSSYSTSGSTITFSEAPATGTDNIEVIHIKSLSSISVDDDSITHNKLSSRFTEDVSITTYTGTVSFDCSNGSVFKLGGDITGAYTIDLTGYKKGQMITIYPLSGDFTLNLDAQGTTSNTFNKLAEADYDGTADNIMQIECVDDSSTDPVFFYSLATFASSSSDI